MEQEVILVDENDREVGRAPKLAAHSNGGQLHRAFSIFVFNSKGETMLQRRAMTKYHTPGRWTNACCSHPMDKESPVDAAHRRLQEEMGFDCEMNEVFAFIYKADVEKGLTEHEYDHVIFGQFEGEPKLNAEEAMDWKWISLNDLKKDIASHPDNYTPWLKIVLDRVIAYKDGV